MENKVYVAYKKYFNGGFVVLGVYYSPDDAKRRCDEAEEEGYVEWADWDSFEIK